MKFLSSIFLLVSFLNLNASKIAPSNSLYFTENKGQVMYQNGSKSDDIKYSLVTENMRIDIKSNSIHYTLFHRTFDDVQDDFTSRKQGKSNLPELSSSESYRVDVMLEGSRSAVEVIPSVKLDYYENYYLEGCGVEGITQVAAYKSLLIENVYPGIDWKLYIDGSKFKYDFIVRKGADASLIKLKYIGAVGLLKDADGNIEVSTPFEVLKKIGLIVMKTILKEKLIPSTK